MRILLINQGHTDNLGDRAIAETMTDLVRSEYPDANIVSMPYIPDEQPTDMAAEKTKPVQFCSEERISALRKIVRGVKRAIRNRGAEPLHEHYERVIRERLGNESFDFAVIGGGELIKGNKHPFYYSLLAWTTVLMERGCPVALLGVSSDARFTRQECRELHDALSKCTRVMVRDKKTVDVFMNQLHVTCGYAPDVVFSYRFLHRQDNGMPSDKDHDAVCVYSYHELTEALKNRYTLHEYYEMWYQLMLQHVKHPVKLLYTTYSDYCESTRFQQWMHDEKHVDCTLASIDDTSDYLKELSDCDTLISGRMHSMIFALQYGTQIVPIPIKSKLATFKQEWQNNAFDWKQTGSEVCEVYRHEILALTD